MNHEQSIADLFREFMKEKSIDAGYQFHSFSLDGQDRDAGADYLFTDSDRFAIIEFKYTDKDLISENKKPRRLTLCQKLQHRQDMINYHDRCHFITYMDSISYNVKTNVYRKQICNASIFGETCGLSNSYPDLSDLCNAGTFAKNFFSNIGSHSLTLNEFDNYLVWLLTEASGSSNSTLELLAINPDSNELAIKRFGSIAEAQAWVKGHMKPTPPNPQRRMRP